MGEMNSGWEMGLKALEMDSTLYFDFATLLAVQDRKNEALDYLEKALANGYRDIIWIRLNPDIHLLQSEARYHGLINSYFTY
jgi:hypothetical protein